LRDALAWVEDFTEECRRLATVEGPLPWPHADSLELVGLERWGTQLAASDREAGVCALVLAAQHGFPRVVAAGGAAIADIGLRGREGEPFVDGAAVEVQLGRAARWVDEPNATNRDAAADALDPTRQLHVWEDDLRPADDAAFYWYLDVGQCACSAIVRDGGDANGDSYYHWPASACVGRGLVVAARGLRMPGVEVAAILRDFYTAMVA